MFMSDRVSSLYHCHSYALELDLLILIRFESILSICVQICTPLLKEAGLCVDALAGLGHTIDGVTGTLGGLGLEGDPVTGLLGGQGLGGGLAGLSF